MRVLTMVCIGVVALPFLAQADNTYSAYSLGFAPPLSPAAKTLGADKKLGMGWDAGWTFFGLPFSKSGPVLSGLAFGGKINYSRWVRDSTRKETTFLGTQGIVRYYTPFNVKPFDLFLQAGGGMFIGEHGFTDPDTIPPVPAPSPVERIVTKGIKSLGVSFNIGLDWDVLECTPGLTMVFTKGKPSTWLSINAAAKF